MDLNKLIQSLDKGELQQKMKVIEQLMQTPEGRAIKDRLMKLDKNELMNALKGFENQENIKADEIMRQLGNNKELLPKIKAFLDAQGK